MRIILKQFKKRLVSPLMKNGRKTILLNPIQFEATNSRIPIRTKFSIRINPNQIFDQNQCEWIRNRNDSDWFWLKIQFRSIRTWIDSDWKLCSYWFGFIRIDASNWIGLSQIVFRPFFIKVDTNHFSDWFEMIRTGSDTDIGMNRNSSD